MRSAASFSLRMKQDARGCRIAAGIVTLLLATVSSALFVSYRPRAAR